MAGITFTVEIDDAAARARLSEMVDRMERPLDFYKEVGDYLKSEAIPRNFETETGPDGTPWASLRPLTVARREANGQTPIEILRASKRLYSDINARPTDDQLTIGSALPYAGVMQRGAKQGAFGRDSRNHPLPWGDIPARPFLGLSPDDELEIIRIAADWLDVE